MNPTRRCASCETLAVTGDHPVWTTDRGWQRVDALTLDDCLRATAYVQSSDGDPDPVVAGSADGAHAPVQVLDIVVDDAPQVVYTLSLSAGHVFNVHGVWVHDAHCWPQRALRGKQVVKLLKKEGWTKVRQRGSHQIVTKGDRAVIVPVYSNRPLTQRGASAHQGAGRLLMAHNHKMGQPANGGGSKLRVYHRRAHRGQSARFLIKCGDCDRSIEVYYGGDSLEIGGVFASTHEWARLLKTLLEHMREAPAE